MGLSNINLSFSVGEFVAVTGESGSGKSTLAHVLGGILPYESGELYIEGKPTSHYDASDWEGYRRDLVGFISQNYGILPGNTVLENVESALRFSGYDRYHAQKRALEILAEVELTDYSGRKAAKLSSGQKQRLSIARALAKPSKILIADEPTGNLDRENSEKVINLLKRASEDRLVILITHEFEEAAQAATRRIIISDGTIASDSKISDTKPAEQTAEVPKKSKDTHLSRYVAGLTLRSRPIFCSIVCLFLAFSSFITFAFLGTFTVALDDSPTRIYSHDAFFNGNRDRIVVMKKDGEAFTEDDYRSIIGIKHVNTLERWGYVNDISYYYRPETDYHLYTEVVNGPNYHSLLNPDDYQITEKVKFIENDLYVRTLPVIDGEVLSSGDTPEGVYEVVSADPDYKIGDKLKIYVRNRKEWSISAYFVMTFTVVGESEIGNGIYFSDKFAAMLSNSCQYASFEDAVVLGKTQLMLAPYSPDDYEITSYWASGNNESSASFNDIIVGSTVGIPESGEFVLADNEICISERLAVMSSLKLGFRGALKKGGIRENFLLKAHFDPNYIFLALVSPATFERYIDTEPDNQISIYIKDYAYTDRVTDALGELGYISVSPFRVGSTEIDQDLAIERMITLAVCLAALILVFILQTILLKVMFSSLSEHFKLMSNIGLMSKTTVSSLWIMLLLFTVTGELIGASAVLILNYTGAARIVGIFKYLDWHNIILLFAVHFISICLASVSVVASIKKAVYAKEKRAADIDISEEE